MVPDRKRRPSAHRLLDVYRRYRRRHLRRRQRWVEEARRTPPMSER